MQGVQQLQQENTFLKEKLEEKNAYILQLEEALRQQRQKTFGASSEKAATYQLGLFNEAEECDTESASDQVDTDNTDTIEVPAHTRQRKKRVSIPEAIEREDIVYDLSDSEKQCPHDGTALTCIGEETHEQLDIIPTQIKALRHIRKKYACPCCKEYLITAKKPKQAIEKSLASSGLLAHIAVSKYADGLPLYRQAVADHFTVVVCAKLFIVGFAKN